MAGAMRKMAVYLGLVEDDGYDGRGSTPTTSSSPSRSPSGTAGGTSRHISRSRTNRTNGTSRTARAREPLAASASLPAESGRPARIAPVASITPERQNLEKNAPVIMPKVVSEREPYRITTLHPRTYNEARTIGEHFREGTPVIMNLTEMDDTDAKRLVDFAAGLVFGLHGSIERVTQKVFLLSPANVDVTAEDKARIAEGGFFNQS